MWPDRLSNQQSPSAALSLAQVRSQSPAARRPIHLAPALPTRPPYSSRASSLSLISKGNSSTGSLQATARAPNGSTLKHEITPPDDVPNPLEILSKIVGSSIRVADVDGDGVEEEESVVRPDELVEDIQFNGLSLEEFVESEAESEDLELGDVLRENAQLAEEYDKEKDKLQDLHHSILACDNVLQSVESSLTSFQKDLGVVSAEIETLQSRSSTLSTRLDNRKIVEKLLGPAVEEISISPAAVRTISNEPIDENWTKALAELEKRLKVVDSKYHGPDPIKAVTDIKPLLDDLTNKALERIRDYLVAQVKALRSPSINAQIIQQQTMLKHKDLYAFLAKRHPQLADEIGKAYVNTIRWYYLNHFTRYCQALDKLSLYHIDKYDALGSDPSVQRPKIPGVPVSHDPFNIGRRADILKLTSQTALSSYLAEEDKSTYHMEMPFRNFSIALIDNVSAEYAFLTEFFATDTFAQMTARCTAIFEPTFALAHALTKDLVESSYDCLGILLCVRLNQHAAFELQRRKVPADTYINGTTMLLWPRFQLAMDQHADSIRALATTVSARSAASKLSFTGSASDASKLSTAPHALTQRFGQFVYGILAVSPDAGDDEPLASSLARLRREYEVFLQRAAKSAGGTDAKKSERFLTNNLALVLAIIADARGRLAAEQKTHFEEAMGALGGT